MHQISKIALVALLGLAASQARSSPEDFMVCDGFGPMKAGLDGLRPSGLAKLLFSATDHRRSETMRADAQWIVSCDRALADPVLTDKFWVRRANLLQGKAMHLMASGDFGGALEAVAESDRIGLAQNDPLFNDSVALGNRMVRAYALIQLGRPDEARKEVSALEVGRPYAPSIGRVAYQLSQLLDGTVDNKVARSRALAPVAPNDLSTAFWDAFITAQFTAAVEVAPHISFDLPSMRGGWKLIGGEELQYELIERRADFAGAWAYALHALGRQEESDAVFAAARRDLLDAAAPPAPRANGRKHPEWVLKEFERRETAAGKGTELLDGWVQGIAVRRDVVTLTAREFMDRQHEAVMRTLPIGLDVFRQLRVEPVEQPALDEYLAKLEQQVAELRREANAISLDDLLQSLPRPEVAEIKPRFRKSDWLISENGFTREKEEGTAIETHRFIHGLASKAMVEELVLLSTARSAQKEGKDSLLINSRRTISRTMNTNMYGTVVSSAAFGNEAQLRVLLIDSKAVPTALGDVGWRLLPVADVLAALEPKYLPAKGK